MGRNQHIYSLDTLLRMAHDVKKRKGRIVLTHGTFDLFHVGHLHLLRQSARLGDFFVVGVDSNENYKRYRNKKINPVIDEKQRMEIISDLHQVDGVFLLDKKNFGGKDAYRNLYKEFKANVITVGRGFYAEDALHKDIRGMRGTKIVKIENDFESTTKILNRIAKRYTDSNP